MDLKEIQQRNYDATVRRGKITTKTTFSEFYWKMEEERDELWQEYQDDVIDKYEIADIIIVCFNMAKHFGIDIQEALEEKTIINENRIK